MAHIGLSCPKRGRTTIAGVLGGPSRSRAFQQWTTPFIMAHVNANTVRTANARVGFAPGGITYTERRGWPEQVAENTPAIARQSPGRQLAALAKSLYLLPFSLFHFSQSSFEIFP